MMEKRSGCRIPVLKTCCMLYSLRAGVLYIAILCMVGAVNNFIIFLTQYDRIVHFIPLLRKMDVSREDRDLVKWAAIIMFGTFAAVWVGFSGMLFYAALKYRSKLLMPWMALCVGSMPMCLGIILSLATLFFIYMSPVYGALCLVFGLLMLGVPLYFLWVVYSFYRELEDPDDAFGDQEKGPFIVHPYNFS